MFVYCDHQYLVIVGEKTASLLLSFSRGPFEAFFMIIQHYSLYVISSEYIIRHVSGTFHCDGLRKLPSYLGPTRLRITIRIIEAVDVQPRDALCPRLKSISSRSATRNCRYTPYSASMSKMKVDDKTERRHHPQQRYSKSVSHNIMKPRFAYDRAMFSSVAKERIVLSMRKYSNNIQNQSRITDFQTFDGWSTQSQRITYFILFDCAENYEPTN